MARSSPITLVFFCLIIGLTSIPAADGPDYYRKFREAGLENEYGIKQPYTLFWNQPTAADTARLINTGPDSNIRPSDYAGPQACQKCHPEIHRKWHSHAHRRMNEIATETNILADFSGSQTINYHRVTGTFFRDGNRFRMALEGNGRHSTYEIQRTIGSRFYQYFTGIELNDLNADEGGNLNEVVLPFGWWIDKKQWVPAVHVYHEVDSDSDPGDLMENVQNMPYDTRCTQCHTTIPWGDMLVRKDGRERMTQQSPRQAAFHYGAYLTNTYPKFARQHLRGNPPSDDEIEDLLVRIEQLPTRSHAATLGVSCEACHHGAATHIKASTKEKSERLPSFYPSSPHLFARGHSRDSILERTSANKNFLCSKCHVGTRAEYASGHHAWNSTEYSEAIRGRCYGPSSTAQAPDSTLTCVHCHDPHSGIGKKWTLTRQQDNQSCIDCHNELKNETALTAHTHHAADSVGSDCMNCHMPKLNEGLQDLVRTHRIFSPTEPTMIEQNQPNACNMCHVDKTLDWTLVHLEKWYDSAYDRDQIARHLIDPNQPATINWLKGDHQPSRMVAGDVLTKAQAKWALPDLVNNLNDPALLNRQFLQKGLDQMLDDAVTKTGYRFHFPPDERPQFIHRIRKHLDLPRTETPPTNGKLNL